MKKFAFTLAEVLITLTIIGVIAALTIPNLIQKYQDEALKTAYKKTYNILNNAYKTVIAETGPLDCYYYSIGNTMNAGQVTKDCSALYNKLFESALKIAKKCENNALQNGCLPENGYKSSESVDMGNGMSEEDANNNRMGCWYVKGNTVNNTLSAVILNDGQIIIYRNSWCIMFVDVNGKKGPNKWGYDLFEFDIQKFNRGEAAISHGYTSCVLVEKGGRTPRGMYNYSILNK